LFEASSAKGFTLAVIGLRAAPPADQLRAAPPTDLRTVQSDRLSAFSLFSPLSLFSVLSTCGKIGCSTVSPLVGGSRELFDARRLSATPLSISAMEADRIDVSLGRRFS
jgi:hypothetical protein